MEVMSQLPHYVSLLLATWIAVSPAAHALEYVLANIDGEARKLTGKVVVEDTAGSMLLETDEGAMWPISGSDVLKRTSDSAKMTLLNKRQLGERLLAEMGPEFRLHESKHYVVVYNTTDKYAKWCSSLLERLQKSFIAFWKKRGSKVYAPKAPLAVLIFNNKASYIAHARPELGQAAGNAIGYYSFQTNRIVMYDLTGSQAVRRESTNRGSLKDISALLQSPEALHLVATIIHEATHQIAFNCGLQTRFVDNPVWLSEGMAVYFETPDLNSNRSWSGIGKVNYDRWDRFRKNVRDGKAANLKTLIATDDRLRNPRTAVDGYAEAWAWNYFLIKWHPKEYTKYLKTLADKPRLRFDQPEQRLADFQQHFGEDLSKLEEEFYRRMSKIR